MVKWEWLEGVVCGGIELILHAETTIRHTF